MICVIITLLQKVVTVYTTEIQESSVMGTEFKEYDKNVIVNANIRNVDVDMFDVRQEPFDIYGLYDAKNKEQTRFLRMPYDIALEVSQGAGTLCQEPAGGRVRFCTDSDYVAIKVETAWISHRPHFTFIESGGFDMYVDIDGRERLQGVFIPPYEAKEGYESIIKFREGDTRKNQKKYITINFPIHACVKRLLVGVRPGSFLGHGKKYINDKPIVFYGSSITHGTGTSRPGLTYSNMISRRLNVNVYNLGFSGQCKGEPRMAEYVAGLDHNAPTPEYLEETHEPFFKTVRSKHPDLPVVMITRPNIFPESVSNKRFHDVVLRTYENALAAGDKNVYFVDGSEYLKEYGYDDCILDGVHPNDLGYSIMADNVQKHIEKIIAEGDDFGKA